MPICPKVINQEDNMKEIQPVAPTMGKTQLAVPDDEFCANAAVPHALS